MIWKNQINVFLVLKKFGGIIKNNKFAETHLY